MAHLEDGVKKLVMAGIGVAAIGAEKAQALAEELIRRGETAVEEGKVLNEELKRKARKEPLKASDVDLQCMPPEQRVELMKKLKDMEGA